MQDRIYYDSLHKWRILRISQVEVGSERLPWHACAPWGDLWTGWVHYWLMGAERRNVNYYCCQRCELEMIWKKKIQKCYKYRVSYCAMHMQVLSLHGLLGHQNNIVAMAIDFSHMNITSTLHWKPTNNHKDNVEWYCIYVLKVKYMCKWR